MAERRRAVPLHEEMRQPRRTVARDGCGKQEPGPPTPAGERGQQEERCQPGASKMQEPGAGAAVLAQVMGEELVEGAERKLVRPARAQCTTVRHGRGPGIENG